MSNDSLDFAAFHPFHTANWPRASDAPADYAGGDRLSLSFDLGDTTEAEKKRAIKAWCQHLPTLTALRGLNLWTHVTPPLFEAACRLPDLEVLQIKWSSIRQLDSITALAKLRYLRIGSSTKIESIAPLAQLTALRVLELENFKLIADFSPLERLTSLESLVVAGSMWTRQDVGGLDVFARMTWLQHLALDTTRVTSLRPLAALTQLQSLDLGGRLPMAEYAWLSAKLPTTACRWFQPYLDLADSGIGRCPTCAGNTKVMVTGKGLPVICRICDAAKLEKFVAAFAAVRDGALSTS